MLNIVHESVYTQFVNNVHHMELKMFRTLTTLVNGANARAEERVRDHFCIELIDQKIREAEATLKAAKYSFGYLMMVVF